MKHPLYCLLISLLLPITAGAEVLKPQALTERLNPKVDVSGGVLGGLMSRSGLRYRRGAELHFRLAAPASEQLCVQLGSRDGRYAGSFRVPLAGLPAGAHRIAFTSEHAGSLAATAEEVYLGVLATIRRTCDDPITRVLPVAWGEPVDPQQLVLLVNSGRSDVRVLVQYPQQRESFPCQPLTQTNRIAFDQRCPLELRADGSPQALIVRRRQLFDELPAIRLPM